MDKSEVELTKVALVERNIVPQGIALNNPKATASTSQQNLIALATEIQKADSFIQAIACNKMQIIVEQIKFLQDKAKMILLEADWNIKLHHVACNFVKQPGHVYHLYERETGQLYFSMLSPEEWGRTGPPQTHKGAYRLEEDRSWTLLQKNDEKIKDTAMIAELIFPSTVPLIASTFKSIDLNVNKSN
ncbi:uncharacterized protein C1orf50 homolog [Ptiloglossa arizonensis]|uniref:uncharacterized protein C1orf50 homolog n=1 Tax=Ptiloglossa arizonensis TaxID=3350558 RepID=UPI003FA0114F